MSTHRVDHAIMKNDDPVHNILDAGDPVGDDDANLPFDQLLERPEDDAFRDRVQGGIGLI